MQATTVYASIPATVYSQCTYNRRAVELIVTNCTQGRKVCARHTGVLPIQLLQNTVALQAMPPSSLAQQLHSTTLQGNLMA